MRIHISQIYSLVVIPLEKSAENSTGNYSEVKSTTEQ